jgi:hypothetical protein
MPRPAMSKRFIGWLLSRRTLEALASARRSVRVDRRDWGGGAHPGNHGICR